MLCVVVSHNSKLFLTTGLCAAKQHIVSKISSPLMISVANHLGKCLMLRLIKLFSRIVNNFCINLYVESDINSMSHFVHIPRHSENNQKPVVDTSLFMSHNLVSIQ